MASLTPLNMLSIETATLSNADALLSLVGCIIAKVKETRVFKSECAKLANTCIMLSLAFLEDEAALRKVRSGKDFIKCLREVFLLVTQCTEHWSILHIGWEVVIRRRVETLTKELELCQKSFN